MPRATADKSYRTFAKGLITEATGLTFPEDSARDIDNCDIELKGLVRRRLGLRQESGGTVLGLGSLTDQAYANNTGGPLSLNPSTTSADVSNTWDGTVADGWALADSGNAEALITGGVFRFGSTQGGYGYMNQQLDVTSYDRVTLEWESRETTDNEPGLIIGLGVDSAGLGEGLVLDTGGIYKASFAARDNDGITNLTLLSGGYSYSGWTRVRVTMVPVSAGLWSASAVSTRVSDGQVVQSITTPLAVGSTYIEFRVASGQSHFGRWEVDNISLRREAFGTDGDTGFETVPGDELAISHHIWTNAAGLDGYNWLVTQIGNRLYFRDHDRNPISVEGGSVPTGSEQLDFDGPGNGFIYNTTAASAARVKLQSAVGTGRIWFTSSAVVPFFAEYDPDANVIRLRPNGYESNSQVKSTQGQRLIRDFNGIDDGTDNEDKPSTITAAHAYNLLNQGWGSSYINTYKTGTGVYPSNAQQWVLGKDNSDAFDADLLDKQDFGNSRAPRGRFTLDALSGDRDGIVHSITGLTNPITFADAEDEVSPTGWSTIGFFAGRVWFAGDTNRRRANGIYFSKTLSQPAKDSGIFMQENDPTSEHFPDLLDTDGGVIYLPEADRITRLVPFGSGLLVGASNGWWMIVGGRDGFTASSFSREKISDTGTISGDTVLVTDQAVVYWADNGIHAMSMPDQGPLPVVQDVSQTKIFDYFNSIKLASRRSASGAFDRITKKAIWLWQDGTYSTLRNLYNRALIFDTRTGAFTKYSFASFPSDGSGIVAVFPQANATIALGEEPVVDSFGVVVTDSLGNVVTTEAEVAGSSLNMSLKVTVLDGASDGLRLGELASRTFYDFVSFPGITPVAYNSYLVTGDETLGDLQRDKQATYVHAFFRRTETGFTISGVDWVAANQSGCLLRGQWDWHNTAAGGRWSNQQRAYRYRRPYAPTSLADTFDTGEEIVYTKLKVRGKGRALTLRFDSVEGQDFQLLGFSIPYTANGV